MGLRSRSRDEFPAGSVWFTRSSTIPPGWLECNGQSTAGHPALAALVGANVPDMRGRVPVGVGTGSGLTARTLGTAYGAEGATLAAGNLPLHSHGGGAHTHGTHSHAHTGGNHDHGANNHTHGASHDHSAHGHGGTVIVGASGYHTHNTVAGEISSYAYGGYVSGVYSDFGNAYAGYNNFGSGGGYVAAQSPETGAPYTVLAAGDAAPVTSQGSGTPVPTVAPSVALTFIIKA